MGGIKKKKEDYLKKARKSKERKGKAKEGKGKTKEGKVEGQRLKKAKKIWRFDRFGNKRCL